MYFRFRVEKFSGLRGVGSEIEAAARAEILTAKLQLSTIRGSPAIYERLLLLVHLISSC